MLCGVGEPPTRTTLVGQARRVEVAAVVVRVAHHDLVGAGGEAALEHGVEVGAHVLAGALRGRALRAPCRPRTPRP